MSHQRTRRFQLVDVFGTGPFTGNPLAVIEDSRNLSTDEMQQITRWLNLSETAFLLPAEHPDADYRVRIFTLAGELPFAGHPTLGSCHAWLVNEGRPRQQDFVIQECAAGLIAIRRTPNHFAFAAPPLVRAGPPTEAEIAETVEVLRIDRSQVIDAQWVDNGPGWIAVMLSSAEEVLAIEPVAHYHRRVDIGIVGPHTLGDTAAFEVRAIFSDAFGNLIEDPATGSLNAGIGQWFFSTGRTTGSYSVAQGSRLGRSGRLEISQDEEGQIWVGGGTITLFNGTCSWPSPS